MPFCPLTRFLATGWLSRQSGTLPRSGGISFKAQSFEDLLLCFVKIVNMVFGDKDVFNELKLEAETYRELQKPGAVAIPRFVFSGGFQRGRFALVSTHEEFSLESSEGVSLVLQEGWKRAKAGQPS